MVKVEPRAAGQEALDSYIPLIPLSNIALTGVYEISKILSVPNRLETTLSNVVNLLSSFMQMRHGVISLLADDGVPDITVGAGWNEGTDERYRRHPPTRQRPSQAKRPSVIGWSMPWRGPVGFRPRLRASLD